MTVTKRKKILIGLTGTILLLALLNPTQKDFEKYLAGKEGIWGPRVTSASGRIGYYLIFSIYQYNDSIIEGSTSYRGNHKYIGVFKNFYHYYSKYKK